MGIFEAVKAEISMMSAAKHYGIPIKHSSMTNCIFHNDSHPSMKLYKDHFHCFSCGAHGDVIAFTAQLFGLSQYDAAKKLVGDFSIPYDRTDGRDASKVFSPSRTVNKYEEIITLLSDYIAILEVRKARYSPASPDEELHPLYAECLQELPQYQYFLDILVKGSDAERNEFIKSERRFIHELRAKVRNSVMAV